MSYKFTTIEDCENKLKKFKQELEILHDLIIIQFPIADNKEEQFNHLSLNYIRDGIDFLEIGINDLEKELENYKKKIAHNDN